MDSSANNPPDSPPATAGGDQPIFLKPDDFKTNYCNICGAPKGEFYAYYSERPNRCKRCESLERHRIFKWAYDWFIQREFRFEGKEILSCAPGDAEIHYLLKGAKRLVTFDVRPVSWFDIQADIGNMPQIPSASFDCFVAMSVLTMTREDRAAIDEIYRVLRPGGRFFTQASNNLNGRTEIYQDLTRYSTAEEFKKYGVATYRVYGDLDLIKLVSRRFAVKTFHGFDPITGDADFIVCGIKE